MASRRRPTPRWSEAQATKPVVVHANPATCSVQFDPVGTRRFDSSLRHRQEPARRRPASPTRTAPTRAIRRSFRVGTQQIAVPDGAALDAAGFKALKDATAKQVKAALAADGYPAKADPAQMKLGVIFFWLMVFVVAATALYGPQASALVEMFPTRVRYTAMSLPYHVGTGWVGGFLPVTSFALVAITGDIYAGLWYPVIFTVFPIIVALIFLKETRGKPLGRGLTVTAPSECRSAGRPRPARGRSGASSSARPRSPVRASPSCRRR